MAPRSASFKRLQQRLRRSLCYGNRRMKTLPLPLSELAIDYFDKHSPYDYMNMDFATSLARDGCVDACTFLVAMVYLDRMRTADKTCFEASDPGELYLSALIIACKYLHDGGQNEFIYNDEWAASASTSLKRVNELELNMLNAIHWDASVSNADFMRLLEDVENWVAIDSFTKRGFCTYNEMVILGSRLDFISNCIKPLVLSLTAFTVVYSTAVASLLMAPQIAITINMHRDFLKSDGFSVLPLISSRANICMHQRKTALPFSPQNTYQRHIPNAQRFFQISSVLTENNVPLNRTATFWGDILSVRFPMSENALCLSSAIFSK